MISKDAAAEMLSRTALFGAMEADQRRAVVQEMREISFDANQAIFARGDAGRDIYFVMTGRVRLSVLTPEGRELSFAHAEAGQIFGEIAVLDGGMRTADATAVTKVQTLALSKAALMSLIETRPKVGEGVIKFLCNRVREADQQLEGIALYPIEVRLALFFLMKNIFLKNISQGNEKRQEPGRQAERQDRQEEPHRLVAAVHARREALEMLLHEEKMRELVVPDRDRDEPRRGERKKDEGP